MLCQQSDAGEMAPSSLRENVGVGVVLEGGSMTGPETQPSDNMQQSHSSSRWDA